MTESLSAPIEQTIVDQMHIAAYSVVSRFYSRRNEVVLVHARRFDGSSFDFVYKRYIAGQMETEYRYLSRMQGVLGPLVLAKGTKALALEYIKGPLLIEKLEETEKTGEPFYPYLDMLIDFLDRFYKVFPGCLYGDINLRNFIIAQNGLRGIDLELAGRGEIADDIGRTAAYLLTYEPSGTRYKKDIAQYFIHAGADRFGISEGDIMASITMELDDMRKRRRLKKRH